MQWSCPYCNVTLSVAGEKIGPGWSFCRCYKCSGFALVRKSEINIIKVDKAPPGEKILLPQPFEGSTTSVLNASAFQNLNNFNELKPSTQEISNNFQKMGTNSNISSTLESNIASPHLSAPTIPDPLPSITSSGQKNQVLSYGVIGSAGLAIISGFYLYNQGEKIWHNAYHINDVASTIINENENNLKNDSLTNLNDNAKNYPIHTFNQNTKEDKQPSTSKIFDENEEHHSQPELIDQVQHSAMAAIQNPPPAPEEHKINTQSLLVKIRNKRVNLHSGPGIDLPVIGVALPGTNYIVTETNDRWFKLLLSPNKLNQNSGQKFALNVGQDSNQRSGWIRNDYVQILSETPQGRVTPPNINPFSE